MEIDEKRTKVLTKFSKRNGIINVTESDHNVIICDFSLDVVKTKKKRKEVFTLRDETCLEAFRQNTMEDSELKNCFVNQGDIKKQGKRWFKVLKQRIRESFKKVRVGPNKSSEKKNSVDQKLDERAKLKNKLLNVKSTEERHKLEDRIDIIEEEIADESSEKYIEKIAENVKGMTNMDGKFCNNSLWKLKKKLFPRESPKITIKKDTEGNLISNPEKLKSLYLETYVHRLRQREIVPELSNLKTLREHLFMLRLESSRLNKSPDWEMENLDKVLKRLKKNKTIDPTNLVNELFRPEVIGDDLKESLLTLLNKVKEQLTDPEFMQLCNIVSIYKGKGDQMKLENDRGIFLLNIIRMI